MEGENHRIEEYYEKGYMEEYEHYNKMYIELSGPARDKQYVTAYVLFLIHFVYGFRNSDSILDQRIRDFYLHLYKLGIDKTEIIKGLPKIIEEYRKEREEFYKLHKSRLTLSWQYTKGILPGWVLKRPKNDKYFAGSPFENCTDFLTIAKELGKLHGLNDFRNYLTNELNEKGHGINLPDGLKDFERIGLCLETCELNSFLQIFQKIFASISYQIKTNEAFFHSHILIILKFLGFDIIAEESTNKGRIDCTIETEKFVYIVEFKEKSAQKAIDQIINRKYFQKFEPTVKKIILVGIAFDNDEKNLTELKFQCLNQRRSI
jgi:hypothetical protein